MKTFVELVEEIKKGFDKEDNSVLSNLEDNIEYTSTATVPHTVGTYLVYNKAIYRVTAAIATGDTLTPGTNITVASDIMSMLAAQGSDLSDVEECIAPVESTTSASRAYAIGEMFIKNHTLYKAKTAITAGDTLVLNTNYEAASTTLQEEVEDLTAKEAEDIANEALTRGTLGAKNLLPNEATTQTVNGIIFTVNDDGTVTANGTATAEASLRLLSNKQLPIKTGNYILSGNISSDTRIVIYDSTSSSNIANETSAQEKEFSYVAEHLIYVTLYVNTGVTVSDVIFKPMIRLATDVDDTYQPYAKTNRELTDDVKEIYNMMGVDESDSSILGLQIDFANKTFTRLAAAKDLTAGSDFDSFPEFGGRKRCNVADDGTVNAYYGDSGYSETGSNGQVMVEQPAFYYKVQPLKLEKNTTTGIGYHLRKANYYVSHIPHPGFKLHPAFYDADGNAVSKIFIGAYEGCLYDASASAYITDDSQVMDNTADKFSSIASAKPASGLTQDLTRVKIEQMAQNRGTDWHGQTAKTVSVTQLLAMIEYGTPDIQRQIGMGVVSKTDDGSTNMANNTGATASLGNASGRQSGTDGLTSVTYRGEENAWGNIWKFVYGINIWGNGSMGGGEPYICKDFNFTESKNSDNYDGAGFTVTNAGGYISAFGYGKEEYDWLMMCSEASGNDALPVGDYAWLTANLNGYRIALLGAQWGDGLKAGLFGWFLAGSVGARARAIGGRLVCVPTE